jgi:hypothetical protein
VANIEIEVIAMRAPFPLRLIATVPTIILVAFLSCSPVRAAPSAHSAASPPTVDGVWISRQLQYVYRGMTARYSCEGLKSEIEHLLMRLGARHLRVQECGIGDRPIPFPSVHVTMQVLVPATQARGGPRVAAHWHRVRLFPQMYEGGSCELIEEFRRTFLPLFEARNIEMSAACVPHHPVPGNRLYAEVLTPNSRSTESR